MEWPYNSEQDSLGYYSFEPGQENTHAPQSQPDYAYHVSSGHGISPDDMIIDNPQTDQQDFTCFQTMQPISYTFEQLTQLSLDMTMLGPDQVNQAQSLTQPLHFDEMHSTFAEMSLDSINTTLLPQIATGTGQHPQPSSQEITDQEWEAKKEDIRRVYIHDNLSLKKTMELLKSSWRRPPTEAMYKSRLRQWGPEFSKNRTKRNAGSIPNQDDRQPRRREAPVPTIQKSPPTQPETFEAFVINIRTFLGRVFDGTSATWRVGNFNFQSNSITGRSTRSWELLFHQSQEAAILARGSRTGNLKFVLEDMLLSIKSRFLDGESIHELNDPYVLVYLLRILMVFHTMRRRGIQRLEKNRQGLSETFLDKLQEFVKNLPSGHPLEGFIKILKVRLQLFRVQSKQFREGQLAVLRNNPDEFVKFLSWAHSRILQCLVSHVGSNHPVILNMTEYHIATWKRAYMESSISIEAQYDCLRQNCQGVDPSSEDGITLLLDYAMMSSNKNKNQGYQSKLVILFEELRWYSLQWVSRQEPLIFLPPTYAFIFSTGWLANKAYEFPRFFFSPPATYLEEGVESLLRGDQDCCIWASSFSKRLKLWYKGSNRTGKFRAELKREKKRLHDLTINLHRSVVLRKPMEREKKQSKRNYDMKRRKEEEEEVFKLTGV
ncbi:hypothetical protein NOF04DRAFT_9974 [Fusarium oxysporum II5]|uniref:Clr5 domain-containing protein n=2 Tax=Fusarium oxysporum species complex TaxID=171631 RepID=X0KGN8_FUSO5|nr:uncharacterized protein FOIG_11620 [Fusarium odoratissimum NRRL 54006]EXL96079.1 hypothetical protein FOIG_11620 [Fusarium odoratissimum NRRL 54006]KAK2123862.1 hypothetical protein NOF04DRAFT_9974 [Fusarium oxysporum II5]TXB95675.1 hypothetical protein FocTR4_00016313 [Fusarium oxysporum f. sp. cubense]